MKLPNGERALVELSKLVDYCLDSTHPRGRHKARVFAARLGVGPPEATSLRVALLDAAARSDEVFSGTADGFGRRYILDLVVSGPKGDALVRSAWIVRAGEDFPRFTTCYVL